MFEIAVGFETAVPELGSAVLELETAILWFETAVLVPGN